MTYKITQTGWMLHIPTGKFVNPENNEEYLKWLNAGNTPQPADPISPGFLPLSRRQFFRALHTLDLLDGVNSIIESAPLEAKLDFEHATIFERNDPTLIAMANALGKTEEEIDELFTIGATY